VKLARRAGRLACPTNKKQVYFTDADTSTALASSMRRWSAAETHVPTKALPPRLLVPSRLVVEGGRSSTVRPCQAPVPSPRYCQMTTFGQPVSAS
jgi:hypothetical protein